jgi:5-methyltetrahydropteroyltriglutamate--homocysteine methyltransferase
MQACVPILQDELRALEAAGVDHVQLDEPWLLMLCDARHRSRYGASDFAAEADRCVALVNDVLHAAPGLTTSLHLCHGHFNRQRATSAGYEDVMPYLGEMHVDRLALEFAGADPRELEVLAAFPDDKILGLGVVDHCTVEIEPADTVVERAEAALRYVPSGRLTLNPDCGFAPGSQNPVGLDHAYGKLQALCHGAAALRERHG